MEVKEHTPLEFKVEGVAITHTVNNFPTATAEHQINAAYCTSNAIVNLKSGKISLTKDPLEPSQDPWFVLQCYNQHKAGFLIVSDGSRYFPYDSARGMIGRNYTPKNSIDLSRLSTIDRQIVETAIHKYIFP